jgi:hypothetical protein
MGAPTYVSPDAVAHFDSIKLEQAGPNRVRVTGARGAPAPEKLKVSISFAQGYRAFGRLVISGPDALAKARRVETAVWDAVGGRDSFEEARAQIIGWDACHPPLSAAEPSEVILQLAVRDADRDKIEHLFAPQIVPRVLGTVPGITYLADQGRPRASDVVGYWPALVSRDRVDVRVIVGDEEVAIPPSTAISSTIEPLGRAVELASVPRGGRSVRVPLLRLALARSGDKGDTANIGVIARSDAIYAWMVETLTPAFVQERFAEICHGGVERFEVPNLRALNFLLHGSLGGGGTLSLLVDAQGKTYSSYLLAAEVEVDQALLP